MERWTLQEVVVSKHTPTPCLDTKSSVSLVELTSISKTFVMDGRQHAAVKDVSFNILPGQCVGLVGESGSGKSTLANMILGLLAPSSGQIFYEGTNIAQFKGAELRQFHRKVQAVFQNPFGSFDPRKTLLYSIAEGPRNFGESKYVAHQKAHELARQCGLNPEILSRYPHEVSGGQCQRAALARALILRPQLLVCDEATSALDVTVQSKIISLLQQLRHSHELTLLFISHDIALISNVCDHLIVMHQGSVVEMGPTPQLIHRPATSYTQALLEANRAVPLPENTCR